MLRCGWRLLRNGSGFANGRAHLNAAMWNTMRSRRRAKLKLTQAASGRVFELETSGFIELNDSVSSSELNQSGASAAECLIRCEALVCAAAVLNESSRICLILVIHDESSGTLGPNGSHVTRQLVLRTDAAVRLWKSMDFEEQLRFKSFRAILRSRSSGRNGSVQLFSVPFAACFRIEAFGAAGGNTTYPSRGGRGASAAGSFLLETGTRLDIVIGQAGGNSECFFGAGGGGGSFVYISNGTGSPRLLLAAGGGGGASWCFGGVSGDLGINGTYSWLMDIWAGPGGAAGQPGLVGANRLISFDRSCGGPGAGWLASAQPSNLSYPDPGGPGLSRIDGWLGGARKSSCPTGDGGFGGGGAGGGCCTYNRVGAGGAGGGFSGGGAGTHLNRAGGGGGSFCGGFDCATVTGANSELQGRVLLNVSAACG